MFLYSVNVLNYCIIFYKVIMKKNMVLFVSILLFVSSFVIAQNVPTVTCSICGGYGGMSTMAGFIPCSMCKGSGRMTDPQYQIQQAYNWGKCCMLVANGKQMLAEQKYDEAYEEFREAYNEHSNAEAGYYLGVMYELGMEVVTNRSRAYELYQYAARKGVENAKAAMRRIQTSGYWNDTDAMRNKFCSLLRAELNIVTMPSAGGGSFGSPSVNGNGSSSGRICRGCNGTGRCTMCHGEGRYYVESGTYTGNDTYTRHSCSSCGGSGQCRVCYGKGAL